MDKLKYLVLFMFVVVFYACDNLDISSNQSDSYIKLFGGELNDEGVDIIKYDGGYLIAATFTTEANKKQIGIIKTDRNGNQEEIIELGGSGDDIAAKIILNNEGGIMVLGTFEDVANDNSDIYVAKLNSSLNVEWEETYGSSFDEEGVSIKKTYDGGYVIVGNTERKGTANDNPEGVNNIFLMKIDQNGVDDWDQDYGAIGEDYAGDVLTISNGYLIVGTYTSTDEDGIGGSDIILIETNTFGFENQTKFLGTTDMDNGFSVIRGINGNYIVTGTIGDLTGDSKAYIAEVDANNIENVNWFDTYSSITSTNRIGIIAEESNYLVAGTSITASGEIGVFLEIDSNGNEIQSKSFGGFGEQSYNSIIKAQNSGFAIVGSSGYEGYKQVCLVKVSQNGEI